MAGETTSFFANAILSGLNQGLQGRRALKEEKRLMALKQQEEERLRQAALQDYQQRLGIAQNVRNRALADKQEQMINTAALLGRETNNPELAYYGIAKAFGLDGFKPAETDGANARNPKGASSNLKAIKSDDTLKKIQFLKALRDYNESLSEKQDEFGNTIPAKLSDADRRELALFEERLVRDLYAGGEQLDQGSLNGTPTLGDARAMLFGAAGGPATNSAVSNAPTVNAPETTRAEPDVTPSYTVSLLPVTEPTLYEDVARVVEGMGAALPNAIRQGRRALGDYYDKASEPTTPEDYSGLSTLQKIIYKLTGKNIRPRRLEQILNKER